MTRKLPDPSSFWGELKRRKVVKASLVYLAVAYTILQVTSIIFPALGLPAWTMTFVLALLVIAFILVIILTWIYDITPQGIKVTQDSEKDTGEGELHTETDASGTDISEKRYREKIAELENQLEQARKVGLPAVKVKRSSVWKLALPLILIALVTVVVSNKQRLTKILGFENRHREFAKIHTRSAVELIGLGDLIAAEEELNAALASDPGYSYAWSTLAAISAKRGELDKAVAQTIEALNHDRNNSQAAYNMGFVLDDKNDHKQAVFWYREAIRIDSALQRDSTYMPASSALARIYNEMGMPVSAILLLDRAKQQFPRSGYIYLVYKNLGNAYLLQEQTDSALKYLEMSMRINPAEPETNQFLARAYEAAGDLSKSIDQWQNYIDLETDTSKIGQASRHRKELAIRQLKEIIK